MTYLMRKRGPKPAQRRGASMHTKDTKATHEEGSEKAKLAPKIKSWIAGISCELLDADEKVTGHLLDARSSLEAAYRLSTNRPKT